MNTAKNTQAVQTLVFKPLHKLATMTAEIAIVCGIDYQEIKTLIGRIVHTAENSYNPTSNPSERAVGEKYAYCMMKYITADCAKS